MSICLDFEQRSTTLRVINGLCPAAEPKNLLSATGGGFGLQGIRERIELLGGLVVAEPSALGLHRPGGGAGMRVVVADDQTVVREGLVTLLGTMPGIEVVGSAADGEEAVFTGR